MATRSRVTWRASSTNGSRDRVLLPRFNGMKDSRTPRVFNGLLAASLVTMALVGTIFFGWSVAGLPFVPFDVFDWLTRVLPGRLIAFGIGTMVSVIRTLNLGPTSDIAKLAEQVMAIAAVFTAGVVGGTVLFIVLRAERTRPRVIPGLLLGLIFGVAAMLISLHASATSSVGPVTGSVWTLGAFLVWGAVLGRTAQRLIDFEQISDAAVARIDRRRFLVRLGGTTAAITVAGAVVGDLAEERRREAVVRAGGEPVLWSATNPLPNANVAVEPAVGTRPELTPLERHYRIDINTIHRKSTSNSGACKSRAWWKSQWPLHCKIYSAMNRCTSS